MTTLLSPVQARVIAVLIEKEKTTPDVYPLTVNSLTAGCNQKTCREPVMQLSEREVQAALEELRSRTLVMDTFGASGRVLRYAHNFGKVYGLPAASVAILATLMLRGPQTASELRANCDRLYHFTDASSVEGYLDELANRPQGALAVLLPRQPGMREPRWAHLLSGDADLAAMVGVEQESPPTGQAVDTAGLEMRVSALEGQVAELQRQLHSLLERPAGT